MNTSLESTTYQVNVVGLVVSALGAAIALYLWNERKVEKYLLFWSCAWLFATTRWALRLIHERVIDHAVAFRVSDSVLISVVEFCIILGCYDLLPTKPWKKPKVVAGTAVLLFAYTAVAIISNRYIILGYAVFDGVLFFGAVSLLLTYRSERLPGYAMAAAVFAYQCAYIGVALARNGAQVTNSIVAPLFNVPLALSICVIAQQRARRAILASERMLRPLYLRLATAEEEQRRALHRELHDRIGANLAAQGIELHLIRTLISRGDLTAASEHTSSALTVNTETIAMTRNLMADLRPPALDDHGLFAALKSLADAQGSRLGIVVEVKGRDLATRMSPLVETALFRIAQEAVNNAAKHAAADCVRVALTDLGDKIRLSIADEGVGFRMDEIDGKSEHWGLRTMRERAQAIGATFGIESVPGTGTRITVDVARAGEA